jgi:hypothetical protein
VLRAERVVFVCIHAAIYSHGGRSRSWGIGIANGFGGFLERLNLLLCDNGFL